MVDGGADVSTVQLRLDDGRLVSLPRATAAEATALLYEALERGADLAGDWQGVRTREQVLLVPMALVVRE